MNIRAYIDTNVFIYAIVHHPKYGEDCMKVLRDVMSGKLEGCGSLLVAVELLGAISRIKPEAVSRAVNAYFSLVPHIFGLSEEAVKLACLIDEVTGIGHDSLHLAIMLLNNVDTVITFDTDDWAKAVQSFDEIRSRVQREGIRLPFREIRVVTPSEYVSLRGSRDGAGG